MFGLGGIRKLNDGWIAKQAAHEAQLNRAREHADNARAEAIAKLPSAPTEVIEALDAIIDSYNDENAHANYKCGGTVR